MKASQPVERRFFAKVRFTDTCWQWTARLDKDGYGSFWIGGHFGTNVRAHRWTYEYLVGAIPDGLQIDHLCRNRACVNPFHMEPVSPRLNTLRGDGAASANAAKTSCKRGHPLAGENLYLVTRKSGRKERHCRTCRRDNIRARYHRKREIQALTPRS